MPRSQLLMTTNTKIVSQISFKSLTNSSLVITTVKISLQLHFKFSVEIHKLSGRMRTYAQIDNLKS